MLDFSTKKCIINFVFIKYKFIITKLNEGGNVMQIGDKIKRLRIQNDLTLADLASRCELTKGFLSQVENNITSPSIATLEDILEALSVSVSEFFQDEKEVKQVFQEKDFFIDKNDNYEVQWIVPDAQGRDMEPIKITIYPKKSSQIISPHHGEEFGYVLDGQLEIIYGKKKLFVNKGETFYIKGNRTHQLVNNTEQIIQLIWVANPPIF